MTFTPDIITKHVPGADGDALTDILHMLHTGHHDQVKDKVALCESIEFVTDRFKKFPYQDSKGAHLCYVYALGSGVWMTSVTLVGMFRRPLREVAIGVSTGEMKPTIWETLEAKYPHVMERADENYEIAKAQALQLDDLAAGPLIYDRRTLQ